MKLSLRRKFKGSKYTIGDLSIDGTFFCNTIEDVIRELPDSCPNTSRWIPCKCKEKVYARTAIPTGTYKVTLEYSPKFKRKMPYLHGVPHFLGILIHWGNTEDDSGGCIIVGENSVKGKVINSRATFKTPRKLLTTNPTINWVRSRFVQDENGDKVVCCEGEAYVPFSVFDNPNIAFRQVYEAALNKIRDQATKERLLYGNWDFVEANDMAIYNRFDGAKHLITNLKENDYDPYCNPWMV